MSDTVVVALIAFAGIAVAAIAPTLAVLRTHKRTTAALDEVHSIVNSRLDTALSTIERLEKQIEALNAELGVKRPDANV